MEILLLLLLVGLVLFFGMRLLHRQEAQTHELFGLREEVQRLREQLARQAPATGLREAASTQPAATPPQPAPEPPVQTPLAPVPTPPVPPAQSVFSPSALPKTEPAPMPVAAFTPVPAEETAPPESVFTTFTRNIDWEKFIGENLINKLGIAILVLGIGFFVKYAIDQDWINEVGRVAIGVLAGGVLVGVAHRLRAEYTAFSSVLVGGGMAVLYFTIAIAFHEYHLFGQTVAFLIMVALTGFTIFLSIAYNRMELAVVALIGGFASPFMVSTGQGNYVVLFVFILLLNLGILVLAYFKKWTLLNLIAYVFTIVLYGGWLSTRVIDVPNPPYSGALVFATLFYLVFFLMNILYNVKEQQKFTFREISILLSNTSLYYAAGMYVLHYLAGGKFQGLFTLLLAVFNYVFAYTLYRSQRADRNLVYLLIGLVLTFLSLTAPVQLQGNYITLFWALEAVLLLWLAQKSGIQLMKTASAVVLSLMAMSLLMDWFEYNAIHEPPLRMVLNRYFITGLVALGALAGILFLLHREPEAPATSFWKKYPLWVGGVFAVTFYLVPFLELSYQLPQAKASQGTQTAVQSAYFYLYVLGFLLCTRRRPQPATTVLSLLLTGFAVAFYLFVLHPAVIETRNAYLQQLGEPLRAFVWHYAAVLLLVADVWLALQVLRKQKSRALFFRLGLWTVSFVVVFLASAELEHGWLLSAYNQGAPLPSLLEQVHKIGFPILWGVSSFGLMWLGMSRKVKTLRIISLSLFFLTLLKLFAVDVWDMSEGGKIAAFICLGVILLVVSFMYQKLKKLILVDDAQAPSPTPPSHAH